MRKGVIVHKKSFNVRGGAIRKPKLTLAARRERSRKIRLFCAVFLGIVFLGLCVYFFLFSPFAELRRVEVQTEVMGDERNGIVSTMNIYLDGKRFFLFSRRNFFFFSEGELRDLLGKEFPSITGVWVKKQFPDSLTIAFSDRASVSVWCGADRCFSIDRDGYAFLEKEDISGIRQFLENRQPLIVDESRSGVSLRDTVVNKEILARTLLWDDFLRTRLGSVSSGTYFVEPKNFEEYRIRTEKGWDMRVGKNIAIEDTMKALYAFLQTLPADRQEKLESIDLRIDGKIFFTEKKEGDSGVKVQGSENLIQKENLKKE